MSHTHSGDKMLRTLFPGLVGLAIACCFMFGAAVRGATNIYSTGFEVSEGYDTNLDLAGQLGWTSFGSGGNGLASGFISGEGQQAYLGFNPPTNGDEVLVLWKPVNFDPAAAQMPLVSFKVLTQIADSANGNWDYFRWSFYNTQGDRLFSIEFDNYELALNYQLSRSNELVLTPVPFTNDATYELVVTLNFASNQWNASFGSAIVASNQPITTTGAPLNLGDVDAVWLPYDPGAPGDNFMIFDNYRLTAQALPPPPARMDFLGRSQEGWSLLRVSGANGSRWSVDATTNFTQWAPLRTNAITDAYFDYFDTAAPGIRSRYYRARFVP